MKPANSLRRTAHVLRVALRHLLAHGFYVCVRRWPLIAAKIPGKRLSGPQRLRLAIEEIGGTFIKFGQMLAMQSDYLPLEYCRVLFALFDQVPPFSYAEVEQTFIEDLKRPPLEIFSSFSRNPIATGSVAQVHTATLGTRKVAVKVRRPSILSDFAADIASLRITIKAVKLLHIKGLYWIIAPTEEFVAWTQEELDFRREAHYMDELGGNAKGNAFEKVPKVFWSCTTARILTAEFLDGVTLSEYLRQRESGSLQTLSGFDPNIFAARLIDNFLGDAFRHGMFHADLHPGNLMILNGNVVGYIDFGISGVLSRYSRRHLIAMTLAYARGDLDAMCDSFFRISTFSNNANPEGFRLGVSHASEGWYGQFTEERRLRKSITSIMLDLLIISKNNGVWPQRDVIKYIRSAIALDGLIQTFSPEVDIGRHLEQACERHIKWDSFRVLTSSNAAIKLMGGLTALVRDGFLRAFTVVNRFAENNSTATARVPDPPYVGRMNAFLQWFWIGFCLLLPAIFGRGNFREYVQHWPTMLLSITMSVVIWLALRSVRADGQQTRQE